MYLIDGLLRIYVIIFIQFIQFIRWLLPVSPQCTVLQDITTTPVPTAVSVAQQEPTSLSLGRTTASLAPGTPPLTLTVPPMSPTAKVILLITFSILVYNWDSNPEWLIMSATRKQASEKSFTYCCCCIEMSYSAKCFNYFVLRPAVWRWAGGVHRLHRIS